MALFTATTSTENERSLSAGSPIGLHTGPLPFVIEHLRQEEKANGSFTPDARLILTPALRTGGLLRELPDSETRSLLALLTFLTANGRIEANAAQVAEVLGVSEGKALARLRRLCAVTWQENPIVFEHAHGNGSVGFLPARHVVGVNVVGIKAEGLGQQATAIPNIHPAIEAIPVALAGREAVLSHSRDAYARPRADVEREIAEQLGYLAGASAENEANPVARRLLALGVLREQVDALLASHTEEEITDQLDWLGLRHAKNPARFIVAAIQNRYEPPPRIRLERAIAAEEAGQAEEPSPSTPAQLSIGETTDLTLPASDEAESREEHE